MKVYQINSVCGVRSTGRIVTDIYTALKKSGHECRMAYGRQSAGDYGGDAVKITRGAGVYVDAALSRITGRAGEFSLGATRRLVSDIRAFAPDIVHLHNLHGYYVNAFALIKALADIRAEVVWTLHDCWAFTGHCAYFDKYGCVKWETGCRRCPAKRDYPQSDFFDTSAKQYEKKKKIFTLPENMTLVTPSQWLKNLVSRSFMGRYPVHVIRNGVNGDVFSPGAASADEYGDYVLGVALPFGERKGFSDFIKLRSCLNENIKIVLVGVDERQTAMLPPGITGIKRTDSARKLAALYGGARCFINFTYEDNFPTTNIESLMCGTPVVTYDSGGSPESVFEGAGAVVPKGDVAAAARAAESIVRDARKRAETAACASALFDSRIMAENYIKLYENIIK